MLFRSDLARGKTKGDRAMDALNLLKRGTLQVGTRGVASSETTPTVVEERSLPALEFGYDRNEEPTLEQVQEIMRQQGIPTEE